MWSVVVPVKDLSQAKSRLAVGRHRDKLALAFAQDTIQALNACDSVDDILVVTRDSRVRSALPRGKVHIIDDPGIGLDAAIASGLATLAVTKTQKLAVMVADLPAVTADAIAAVCSKADSHAFGFVADAEQQGTTAVFLRDPQDGRRTRFGARSRQAHLRAGAAQLDITGLDGIDRDIDQLEHLKHAMRVGVGGHTASTIAECTELRQLLCSPEDFTDAETEDHAS